MVSLLLFTVYENWIELVKINCLLFKDIKLLASTKFKRYSARDRFLVGCDRAGIESGAKKTKIYAFQSNI